MLKKGAKLKAERPMHRRYETSLNILWQNQEDLLKQQDRINEETSQNNEDDEEDQE